MNLGALIPLLKLAQDAGLTKKVVVYAKPSEIYTKEKAFEKAEKGLGL
jgi:predicted patatin/cPLA2 family phospholipase